MKLLYLLGAAKLSPDGVIERNKLARERTLVLNISRMS